MIEMQYNFPMLPGQPAEWRERLRAAVDSLGDERFDELRPTFRSDMSALTEVGARWLGMPQERTYLIEGNHQGSLMAMMAAGVAGRPIAVDVAAYTGALEQARALDCPIVACTMDAEGMVAASLWAVCAEARSEGRGVAAMFVIPTVHNPLGCVAGLKRRQELVAVAREFDLVIIEDAAYAFMAPDAAPPLAKLAPERTFYVCGLSKVYAPGTRTGFMVAPEQYAEGMARAIKNCATGANLVHARAAVSLIADGTLDRVVAAKNVEGARRNAAARALLRDERCWPGAKCAWHLWVALPKAVTALVFERTMAEKGVAISGGNWFAAVPDSPVMPNGFRIALGGEVDAERSRQGVKLVAEELAKVWAD
jgi:DNA-binding transcriptional MocR family regulator